MHRKYNNHNNTSIILFIYCSHSKCGVRERVVSFLNVCGIQNYPELEVSVSRGFTVVVELQSNSLSCAFA